MKFGELTYEEIKRAAKSDWIIVVPTGCTEQQGPHLPVDFDTWLAEEVCLAAAKRAAEDFGVQSLVLPAFPFGPASEHRGFGAGYIDVPQEIHEGLVVAVLRSLTDQGFKRIVIWRGCGGHRLDAAVRNFLNDVGSDVNVFLPTSPYQRVWQEIGEDQAPGGHADAFATSLALHLRPEAVRVDEIRSPSFELPDWSDPSLDLTDFTDTGSIGDPTRASSELGRRLWVAVVDEAAATLAGYDRRTYGGAKGPGRGS